MKSETKNIKRKIFILSLKILMFFSIFLTLSICIFMIVYIFINGIKEVNLSLLTTKPSYLTNHIGILPDILNTIYIIITTVIILTPIAVGAAIYLNEYSKNQKLAIIIEYCIEVLSGIPSIIYGLVGMILFCQFFKLKTSLLAGSLTLVFMNLPTMIRTTQESLKTIPLGIKEGAFALGLTKWQVIRKIILPNCINGIVTGIVLSIGRIIGESAALLFTAGFAHSLNDYFNALNSSGASLSVALYIYAKEQGDFHTAFAIAFILLIIVFIINIIINYISYLAKRSN